MKILILGAKGNLGIQLQRSLGKHELVLWDREEADITDASQIIFKIKEQRPNVIINCAAYNAVDKCEEDLSEFELAKKLNGYAPGYIADAALECDSFFVNYSTDFVFGADGKQGYLENDQTNPVNNYGRTKALGEEEVIKRSALGLKYYIIRPSKLFGPRGESEAAKPSFFDIMLKLSTEKDSIDVVDDEKSCFTYTCDLAEQTKRLIEGEFESGIYHITNSEPATWYEAVKVLFELKKIKTKVNPISSDKLPRPAKRPSNSTLINTKLPELRSYKEALKEYLKV